MVMDLSEKKAEQVCRRLEHGSKGSHIVLAADTVVVLDDVVMGKPNSPEEAFGMLESLSGRWHEVVTGVALIDVDSAKKKTHAEKTRVKIRKLSKETILRYIESESLLIRPVPMVFKGLARFWLKNCRVVIIML